MANRTDRIAHSIAVVLSASLLLRRHGPSFVKRFWLFFHLFSLPFTRFRPEDFLALRHDVWAVDEEAYRASFKPEKTASRGSKKGKTSEPSLVPVGDLGYSGSTFFKTADDRYIVKSLPRQFEVDFFTQDLFPHYTQHMRLNPGSLLVRITDLVQCRQLTLGSMLNLAPQCHMVMENLLLGKSDGWETYDLKPEDYFYPERDIADGKLAPESVKAKLIDSFPDKIHVSQAAKEEFISLLSADAQILADNLAVDYSLFLVRYPTTGDAPSSRPFTRSSPAGTTGESWRTGVTGTQGWTYRAVLLDFFWAKHKLQPKAMTALVNTYNSVAARGPMSITAEPAEYRERFLNMVEGLMAVEA